jgi:hypothetical protein
MISRPADSARLASALRRNPVVALVGPRQCGKTTLARTHAAVGGPNYFDLENPADLGRLDTPMTALSALRGLVVIDEVQRSPDLFPVLRVLADRRPRPARFLVLGSAAPELLRQSAESLAGRIEVVELGGLGLSDLGESAMERRWLRGGMPRSLLARSVADSFAWRREFIAALIERDLPQWGVGASSPALRRFWMMLAHLHGQLFNAAVPARSLGVSEPTVRRYLDLLTGLFMVRQLQPWHENLGKRQVKSPKVYLRDSGLLHEMLGVRSAVELLRHPQCGASWEGLLIEEVLRAVPHDSAYFWATHAGAELDLLLIRGRQRVGVEIKRTDAPRLTPSMRAALHDLRLDRLIVLYPGERGYPLADRVEVRPAAALARPKFRL